MAQLLQHLSLPQQTAEVKRRQQTKAFLVDDLDSHLFAGFLVHGSTDGGVCPSTQLIAYVVQRVDVAATGTLNYLLAVALHVVQCGLLENERRECWGEHTV